MYIYSASCLSAYPSFSNPPNWHLTNTLLSRQHSSSLGNKWKLQNSYKHTEQMAKISSPWTLLGFLNLERFKTRIDHTGWSGKKKKKKSLLPHWNRWTHQLARCKRTQILSLFSSQLHRLFWVQLISVLLQELGPLDMDDRKHHFFLPHHTHNRVVLWNTPT